MTKQILLTQSDIDIFWAKVEIGSPNECWNWTWGCAKSGYGETWINKKVVTAHRVAYTATHGLIPDGLFVLHHCDNPRCCNPAHLFLGTNDDNIRDMVSKGRQAQGERSGAHTHPERIARGKRTGAYTHPERISRGAKHSAIIKRVVQRGEHTYNARLNESQVKDIRQLYATKQYSQHELACKFNVSRSTIESIVHGKSWSHLLVS